MCRPHLDTSRISRTPPERALVPAGRGGAPRRPTLFGAAKTLSQVNLLSVNRMFLSLRGVHVRGHAVHCAPHGAGRVGWGVQTTDGPGTGLPECPGGALNTHGTHGRAARVLMRHRRRGAQGRAPGPLRNLGHNLEARGGVGRMTGVRSDSHAPHWGPGQAWPESLLQGARVAGDRGRESCDTLQVNGP